jgi:hypothetical protein
MRLYISKEWVPVCVEHYDMWVQYDLEGGFKERPVDPTKVCWDIYEP